jgi:hypothetical protein
MTQKCWLFQHKKWSIGEKNMSFSSKNWWVLLGPDKHPSNFLMAPTLGPPTWILWDPVFQAPYCLKPHHWTNPLAGYEWLRVPASAMLAASKHGTRTCGSGKTTCCRHFSAVSSRYLSMLIIRLVPTLSSALHRPKPSVAVAFNAKGLCQVAPRDKCGSLSGRPGRTRGTHGVCSLSLSSALAVASNARPLWREHGTPKSPISMAEANLLARNCQLEWPLQQPAHLGWCKVELVLPSANSPVSTTWSFLRGINGMLRFSWNLRIGYPESNNYSNHQVSFHTNNWPLGRIVLLLYI